MTSTDARAPSSLDTVAQALLAAWRGGPTADDGALAALVPTPAAAYAVQDRLVAALDPQGGTPRLWKSGGPSRDAVLTHAPLPAAGVLPSGASTARLALRSRLLEAEIALRLAREVTPSQANTLAQSDAAGLVDAMAVSIELVDSRWTQGRQACALSRLADLQSHGALVLGEFVPYRPLDWAAQACEVRIGAAPARRFVGSHSLGAPAWLLPAWLRHATQRYGTLAAGTVVTTGTWCGLLEVNAGEQVEVDFPGIGTASVQAW